MDSGYTYTEINKQLVKDKKIQTRLINFSFGVYNVDGTKNKDIIEQTCFWDTTGWLNTTQK